MQQGSAPRYEGLQSGLQIVNVNIEFEEVAIKDCYGRIQKVILLAAEVIHQALKAAHQGSQPLNVCVLSQRTELINGCEHCSNLPAPAIQAHIRLLLLVRGVHSQQDF